MPSQQQPDESRLSRAGGADDGDVFSRSHADVDVLEDRVTRRAHRDGLEGDGDSGALRRRRLTIVMAPVLVGISRGRICRRGPRCCLLGRTQRLQQSQREVAMRRILPDDHRDLLSEDGKIERPVSEQERPRRLAGSTCVEEE